MLDVNCRQLRFIDTHTGGEPTRVLIDAPTELCSGSPEEVRQRLADQQDWLRQACILPPRGNEIIVGAIVTPAWRPSSDAGVVFFNNVGYLGMCGHGTIGVAVALHGIGRLPLGPFQFDTPVGMVRGELLSAARASFENVPARLYQTDVTLRIEGREITGHIAWGGNWFFLVEQHGEELEPARIPRLTALCQRIAEELRRSGITGEGNAWIDHIELLGPPSDPARADSRNFVLCPGGEFDRSPCGTGTSAKLAWMAASGLLPPHTPMRQESIIGSIFTASYRPCDDNPHAIVPTIEGEAYLTAEGKLVFDPEDPFCLGIAHE
ncbi:MAG: 4-hydroxyproline epimerase [Pirellulaceae bacterium]|nr:MAG: 4-hydroxyproline epimerase [Pirellulaceae bacterium]